MEIMLIHNTDLNNITFQEIDWDDYYEDEDEGE